MPSPAPAVPPKRKSRGMSDVPMRGAFRPGFDLQVPFPAHRYYAVHGEQITHSGIVIYLGINVDSKETSSVLLYCLICSDLFYYSQATALPF